MFPAEELWQVGEAALCAAVVCTLQIGNTGGADFWLLLPIA